MFATLFREVTLSKWSHFAFTDKELEGSGLSSNFRPTFIHRKAFTYWPTSTGVWKPSSLCHKLEKIPGYDLHSRFPCGIRLKLPSVRLGLNLHLGFTASLLAFPPLCYMFLLEAFLFKSLRWKSLSQDLLFTSPTKTPPEKLVKLYGIKWYEVESSEYL